MNRAWRLLPWIAVFILATGCGPGGFGPAWRSASNKLSRRAVTSDPIGLDPPTSPPAETTVSNSADQPDEELAPLTERIDAYIGQFPTQEPGQQANADTVEEPPASPPAAATPQDTGSAAPKLPTWTATRTPAPATQPAGAAASVPTDVRPNTTIHTEATSSPLPPEARTTAMLEGHTPRVELIDVRPVATPAPATPDAEAAASANHPAGQGKPARAPTSLAGRVAELEQSITAHPEQLDDQLKLRLLYLVTGRDDRATEPFEGLDPVQGELLSALCRVMASAKQAIQEPASASASALIAAAELHRLLGQQSPVVIPKMALVTRVSSFGDYDAVTPPRFAAGRPISVFLYTEVANFRSQPTADGRLRTVLSQRAEIFDATGNIIWQRAEPEIEDRVLSPRRDFFIPFPIALPVGTPPGEYILKTTIEDKIGATTDQQRMTFTIENP